MSRFSLFPVVALTAGALVFVKVTTLYDGIATIGQPALAAEEKPAPAEPAPEQGAAADAEEGGTHVAAASEPEAFTDPALMTRSELDLLQDLAERRVELDRRSDEIAIREGILEATERRIDEKIARLEGLEGQIKSLVSKHEEIENAELASIVKVYQTMKPKDAARIFERLDMEIQVEVATRMKEAKMAPILAAMSAEAAKTLTIELATRAQLPEIEG